MMSDDTHVDGFEFYKTSNIKVTFKKYPKKAWCVDGEKLEIRNKTYNIKNEHDISILLPKKNISKLFIK